MMKKAFCAVALVIGLSGCSTMHFDNGSQVTTSASTNSWHHTALFALIEVSDPVLLDQRCRNDDWSTVRTEVSFLNGLAGTAATMVTTVPLWSPQSVDVACAPLRRD